MDQRFQAIFDGALDPMLVADDDARYVDANPSACEFFGLSREELCERRIVDFAPHEAKAQFDTTWAHFLSAGKQRGEYRLELPDGRVSDVEFSATANITPGRHLSILRDVSERKLAESEREQLMATVQALARTDPLTDLPNRRVWAERLDDELRRAKRSGRPLTIAVVDLDQFKAINDTHGHAEGDRQLRVIADRWREQLRDVDLLVRYGGDEFCLLLPDCAEAEESLVLERLRAVMPDGIGFSAGVATWDGEEPPEPLLERADQALYATKQGGRFKRAARSGDGVLDGPSSEL